MKILIASPDFPYPPNHGGRVDIWNRIKLLSEMGHDIDLAVTAREFPSLEEKDEVLRYVRSVYLFPRKKNLLYLLIGVPYQVSSRLSLRSFSNLKKYDYVLLESEATSAILGSPSAQGAKVLLRVHNNESKYFMSLFKSTRAVQKKAYYLYESLAYIMYSRKVKSKANKILHISSDEFLLEDEENKVKSFFVPPYVNISGLKGINCSASKRVLHIGNLFTQNNINGLQWYIDNVHPILLSADSDYEFLIAGNTRGDSFELRNLDQGRIRFVDSPDSLDALYESSSVFVVPLLDGAGVKLRTLNAMSEGIAVVSTSVGVEGLGLKDGKHYLLGNSSEDFAFAVNSLLQSKERRAELATAAQRYISENLDVKKIITELLGV